MATTNKVKLTSMFADETTRNIEFVGFDSDAAVMTASTLKARINNLNTDTGAFAAYYLSDDGASFTGITGATIVIDNETEIALKDGE